MCSAVYFLVLLSVSNPNNPSPLYTHPCYCLMRAVSLDDRQLASGSSAGTRRSVCNGHVPSAGHLRQNCRPTRDPET